MEPFHAHFLKKKKEKKDRPLSRAYSQNVCSFLYVRVYRKQTRTQIANDCELEKIKDKITLTTLSYSMQKT